VGWRWGFHVFHYIAQRMLVALLVAALSALVLPLSAGATLPGRNGQIAYFAFDFDFDFEDEPDHLWTVNPRGSSVPKLIENDTSTFAFSPRGDLVAVDDGAGLGVAQVEGALGSAPQSVTTLTRPGRCDEDGGPRWSRSGHELIFERLFNVDVDCDRRNRRMSTAIFRIPRGSTPPRRVGPRFRLGADGFSAGNFLEPDWSSRGEIVFQHASPGGGGDPEPSLFTMNSVGNRVRRLTKDHDDQRPSWSPSGTKIAFVRYTQTGCGQIHVIDRDGSGLRRVVHRCYDWVAWSPDGKQLAAANGGGLGFLDVLGARGGPARRLDRGLISSPDWQPLPR
jgi:hypothetical protein